MDRAVGKFEIKLERMKLEITTEVGIFFIHSGRTIEDGKLLLQLESSTEIGKVYNHNWNYSILAGS